MYSVNFRDTYEAVTKQQHHQGDQSASRAQWKEYQQPDNKGYYPVFHSTPAHAPTCAQLNGKCRQFERQSPSCTNHTPTTAIICRGLHDQTIANAIFAARPLSAPRHLFQRYMEAANLCLSVIPRPIATGPM